MARLEHLGRTPTTEGSYVANQPASVETMGRAGTVHRSQSRGEHEEATHDRGARESGGEGPWTEVTRARERRRTKKQAKTRPDVIIAKSGSITYSEMLKKIKGGREMKKVGSNISAVTKTRDGHLRLVLNRGTEDIDNLAKTICSAIGDEASCVTLSDTSTVEIRDADEEASDDEIIRAISSVARTEAPVKIVNKRKDNRGTQIVTATVPTAVANTLVASKLRIGYVNCRVRLKYMVKKCYQCQGFGHTRLECTQEDRSNLCWTCGNEGHKSKECESPPKCFLCKNEPSADHITGSFRCGAYKRALEDQKKNK